jgi:hypothetical protein
MRYTTTVQKIGYISGHQLIYEDTGFYLISNMKHARSEK